METLLPIYAVAGRRACERDKDGLRKRLRQWLDNDRVDFGEAVESAAGNAVSEYVARGRGDDVDGQPTGEGKREEMADSEHIHVQPKAQKKKSEGARTKRDAPE